MTKMYCVVHEKTHASDGGWRWTMSQGGWACADVHYPEFITSKIKDRIGEERKKYLKSQIQSHRQGELSSEFVELYPQKIKAMKKAGVVTDKEIKNAKPVWRDLPGINNVAKTE